MVRLLFDRDRELIPEHARKLIKALEEDVTRNPSIYAPRPRGVASHMAQHAMTCDDCGSTYWAREPWSRHLGCPGFKPHRMGFG